MSAASPETVERMVGGGEGEQGRRGGEKRKAGRNLRSPSPATKKETGWGTGLSCPVAVPGAADQHNDPSPPQAHT